MKLKNVIYCGYNLIWLKKFPYKTGKQQQYDT